MIYQHLFDRVKEPQTVRAAVVGAGDFGLTIITESSYIDRLEISAVADIDLAAACSAFRKAGRAEEDIVVCDSEAAALRAFEAGKAIVVQDASLLMDLPIDVVTTATRVPEAGARYAYEAIQHGKHVVLVDKETDSVIAPILKHLADQAGVVFTTDDGDEPGLLMGLVSWARTLGMEVLCGGNIDNCLYDPAASTIKKNVEGAPVTFHIALEDRWALDLIPGGEAQRYAAARSRLFAGLTPYKETGDPVAHMSLAVNGTGLMPDIHGVHRPVARFVELPEILCPVEDGGILEARGVIEQPIILRTADQPHGGGGIFIVVTHKDETARLKMIQKGLHANAKKTAMLMFRPYHLCGAETAMSILCAGLLRVPTGSAEIKPRVDIVAWAQRDFKAGEIIGVHEGTLAFGFSRDFRTVMAPMRPVGEGEPLPYFMLYGNRLAKDIPAGSLITCDMVERPQNSVLWMLREQQDALFFG
jgi:predicted homoserine dehydrogenase-like protein